MGSFNSIMTNQSQQYENIIVVDTETTGLGNDDRIIQLALLVVDVKTMDVVEKHNELCNSSVPIKEDATRVHKKTNDMIENLQPLVKTSTYELLEKYNNDRNIFVFHNSFFDLYMLAKEMFLIKADLIDTLTCSRNIYPSSKNHRLQTLLQSYCSYTKKQEHDALSDCEMCLLLLENLIKHKNLVDLVNITREPVIGFGKYKGVKFTSLAKKNKDYLEWILSNFDRLDVPTRLIIKCLIKPEELDNTEIKGIRYLNMQHLLK